MQNDGARPYKRRCLTSGDGGEEAREEGTRIGKGHDRASEMDEDDDCDEAETPGGDAMVQDGRGTGDQQVNPSDLIMTLAARMLAGRGLEEGPVSTKALSLAAARMGFRRTGV